MSSPLTFTLFPNLGGLQATEYTTTTDGLADWLGGLGPYANKESCPLISLNRYGEQKTAKGSLRSDPNILEAWGAIGDYDQGDMPPGQAAGVLRTLGIEAVIVTTPSHILKGNRWRVILPFSKPQGLEARYAMLGRINTMLGGNLASESFTASQAFYVGRVEGVTYEVHRIEGVRVDVYPGIEEFDITGRPMAQPRVGSTDPLALIPKRADDMARVHAALALIPNTEPDWETWNRIGMAVYNASGGDDEGLEAWRLWSDQCPGDGDSVDARWAHYRSSPPTELGMGTLVHLAGGAAKIKTLLPPPPVQSWQDKAAVHADEGQLVPIPGGKGNLMLEAAVMVERHIAVAFDEFKQRVVLLQCPPWKREDDTPRNWTDADTIEAQAWMQGQLMKPSKDAVADAVNLIAHRNKNHPVRNYLDRLEWDGEKRLDGWMPRYLGVKNDPYARLIGAKFLIAAVARIYQPGCKADYMVVLEGSQGLQKSTAILSLVPNSEWFTDELPDVTNKDAAIQLHGSWILEVAEMDAMSRAETGATKKFASRRVDKYRPPYGRSTLEVPRQCVFIGTVNPEAGVGYLKDQTGNRRFWPVACGRCDISGIVADRDQLWAEARARYLAGEQWWVDPETEKRLIHPEQEMRRERDPWEEKIGEWLDASNISMVTANLIASVLLKIPDGQLHGGNSRRINNALRALGWHAGTKKQRVGKAGGPVVVFYRDADDPRMLEGSIGIDQPVITG